MAAPFEYRRRATYQDVLDAPEHKVAEIVNGELHLFPRPGGPASVVNSVLGSELMPPFHRGRGGPGGWLFVIEPELHLGDEIVVPDLAAWRRERMSVVPEGAYFSLAPDWICEVLSRSTEKFDRAEKMAVYAAFGVTHAWLVHPLRRTLEAFRLHDGHWLSLAVHKDDDRARVEPFDAIELDLAVLWADTPPPVRAGEEPAEYDYEYAP